MKVIGSAFAVAAWQVRVAVTFDSREGEIARWMIDGARVGGERKVASISRLRQALEAK